ncbi:cyclic nucleotide-binding/CBS domain-containing protein [Candidatus Altiarchaeota archaeon]
MKIAKDIMHGITVVRPDMTVQEAAKLMAEKVIGSVLVQAESNSYGILTERDLLQKVLAEGLSPEETKVEDVMTELQHTVDAKSTLEEISDLFSKHNIRRLPVTEEDKIIGILTTRDVARNIQYVFVEKMVQEKAYRRSFER